MKVGKLFACEQFYDLKAHARATSCPRIFINWSNSAFSRASVILSTRSIAL